MCFQAKIYVKCGINMGVQMYVRDGKLRRQDKEEDNWK